jgi:repressor LexA
MRPLTTRQQEVLDAFREFAAETGYPPSTRELMQRVGLHSSSTMWGHLRALVRKGCLMVPPGRKGFFLAHAQSNWREEEI